MPNGSLSRRGMWIVLGVIAAFNGLTVAFLLIIGAYPVPIFVGLDLVGLGVAFAVIEHRRKTHYELLRVSSDAVEVMRRQGGVARSVWSTPPAFTRVMLDTTDEDAPQLSLISSGRVLGIGSGLGADRRRRLAAELQVAISLAKNERYLGEA